METLPEWKARHEQAMLRPRGFERPIVGMLRVLSEYAALHQQRYEWPIGEDSVLGEQWRRMASALLVLLNGETGRLDCGTLDGAIRRLAANHGVTL